MGGQGGSPIDMSWYIAQKLLLCRLCWIGFLKSFGIPSHSSLKTSRLSGKCTLNAGAC